MYCRAVLFNNRETELEVGQKRTTLIQDMRDFNSSVFPIFVKVYNKYNKTQYDVWTAYYWFICELIERIHNYSVTSSIGQHDYKQPGLSDLYHRTRSELHAANIDVDVLFHYYVKGPRTINTSNDIRVTMSNNDIVFTYYWEQRHIFESGIVLTH